MEVQARPHVGKGGCASSKAPLLLAALASVASFWVLDRDAGAPSAMVSSPVWSQGREARLSKLPRQADPNQWTMLRDLSKKQMPRKPPFIAINLLNKITRMNKEGKKETIRVFSRQSTIIPAMIGHTCAVHNGREFVPIVINEGMVGFKLGDFVPTHTFTSHPKQAKVTKYRGR
ncbi:rpsS [Symbiodinium pilosum]|uniref:Small ribosomal subunit protein uS19c n=1 Tax=Symbiodinium pilosum TaxID=2952 RepID=A0A812VMY6_SYMPI|nr:rpsS [Symbiodinium pilosum]